MQPQKIALVSKLKVENLLALKKNNPWRHKRTHKQLQTQPRDAFDPKFSSDGECWQYFSQYPKKNLFPSSFFPLLQPFHSTFNFRVFFAPFSQKTKIQAPFSELSEGKCETLFLSVSSLRRAGHISGTKVVWRQNPELFLAPWLWLVNGIGVGKGYRTIQCNN